MLLTSGGITNKSIADAFLELVGKPAKDIKVAFIITASIAEEGNKDWLIKDLYRVHELGCYVDVLDIASMSETEWRPRIESCDVIFVGGGNTFYLSYWMEESGLFAALPELLKSKVYAGISAGSIVMGSSMALTSQAITSPQAFVDENYDLLGPVGKSSATTLNLVKCIFRPHLNSRYFSTVRKDLLEEKAKELGQKVYALDDQSALQIMDDKITVISEGEWLKI